MVRPRRVECEWESEWEWELVNPLRPILVDMSSWKDMDVGIIVGLDVYHELRGYGWHVGKVVSLSGSSKITSWGLRSRFSYTMVFDNGVCEEAPAEQALSYNRRFRETNGLTPIRVIIEDISMRVTSQEEFHGSTVVRYRDTDIESPVSMSVVEYIDSLVPLVGLCIGRKVVRTTMPVSGKIGWAFLYGVAFEDGVIRLLDDTEMTRGANAFENMRHEVQPIEAIF